MPRKRESARYLTSAQVAIALGLTKGTLHYWIKNGKVPPPEVNPDNGYYRWTLADVEAIRQALQEER
jgi:DNA-binding transcriptional MerR regulator